ncbi:hypothetical protein IU487_22700 [Nocardia puris]|uniref:hypothetical protein n=1 Tax=Nocardia puris TaxID=208602 RepID=UPI001895ACF1|nr:hypothetical protein [Nocardia puris]MBF6213830.1 hypothetical protein [Nocardia puris]
MGTTDALGVVCLDLAGDLEDARRTIRATAGGHELEIADVMTFRRTESGWVFRLIESVHRYGAHAVVVPGVEHVKGFTYAVRGVADLIAPGQRLPYAGYGSGFTRPSRADHRGGTR